MRFRTLLLGHREPRCVERITETLDRMDARSRLWTVLSLAPKEFPVLWELMAGRSVTTEHFVPSGTSPLTPVLHHGKNSMALFSLFQKRFCRAEGEEEVWGYNHQPFSWFSGPGYFVGRAEADRFVFDYTKLPREKPASWPELQSNEGAFARLVFGGMLDEIRGVSEHVCIGRAARRGKVMDAWFVLCREAENS